MHYNQMMLGIDRDLHVVADNAGATAARCRRTAVEIGQRDLRSAAREEPTLQDISFLLLVSFC